MSSPNDKPDPAQIAIEEIAKALRMPSAADQLTSSAAKERLVGVDLGHVAGAVGPAQPISIDELVRRVTEAGVPVTDTANVAKGELPGTKTLDYIALGLILGPPGILLEMYVRGEPIPMDKAVPATIVSWFLGGVALVAAHWWQRWRSANGRISNIFFALENQFWGRGLIALILVGAPLAIAAMLSRSPAIVYEPAVVPSQQAAASKAASNSAEPISAALTAGQAPQPKLSEQDIETKLSVWDSVNNVQMNALVNAYNRLDAAMTAWDAAIETAQGRRALASGLLGAKAALIEASRDLEALRSEYPNYRDISDGLAQPYKDSLLKALSDFVGQIGNAPDPLPPNYETKLRPFAGALRREMDKTQAWLSALRSIAYAQRVALSRMQ